MSLCWTIALGDERRREDHRREEQDGVAEHGPLAPGAGRHDVQADDEIGRREGEELERREERGQDPGEQDAGRPPADARDDEQDDHDEPRQPQRRGPVGQEAGAEDRRDLEVRPAVGPGVVVRPVGDEAQDVALAGDDVADEPDPAQAAGGAGDDRRDRGHGPTGRRAASPAPRRPGRERPRTARWSGNTRR